jgi:hypothetical protein
VRAREIADARSGRQAFKNLLEEQGLASVVGDKATSTRLLAIMRRLPEVMTWRGTLTPRQQVDWSAPTTIFKHAIGQDGKYLFRAQPAEGEEKKPSRKEQADDAIQRLEEENTALKMQLGRELNRPRTKEPVPERRAPNQCSFCGKEGKRLITNCDDCKSELGLGGLPDAAICDECIKRVDRAAGPDVSKKETSLIDITKSWAFIRRSLEDAPKSELHSWMKELIGLIEHDLGVKFAEPAPDTGKAISVKAPAPALTAPERRRALISRANALLGADQRKYTEKSLHYGKAIEEAEQQLAQLEAERASA